MPRVRSRSLGSLALASMKPPVSYVRILSLTEAVSYLVLLGVAMPLKYAAGMPLAVTVFGMIHGVLFLALLWILMRMHFETSWPKPRLWTLAIASLVPIWPFFLDRHVRRWVAEHA